MENWCVAPLCLVIMKIVLGEAAGIHDAEMRVDTWPLVRRGLAAIIEAGPGKSAGHPGTLGVNGPPILGKLRPGRNVQIVSANVTRLLVVLIDPACAYRAGGFSTDRWLLGRLPMKWIHLLRAVIIVDLHRGDRG